MLKFDSIFACNKEEVGLIQGVEHCIALKDGDRINYFPNRRVPLAYEEKVQAAINELLKGNIIRPSKSPYRSPIVVVPKKDGEVRLCVDYRQLNDNTVRPSFYLPDSNEIFDKLGGNKYYSTLDMQKGYYQIKMSHESIHKTAFTCSQGHYEFLRMPFGLCGAPSTFQRAVQSILIEENNKSCLIYLDDIIVFGRTLEEHNERLLSVLKRLHDAGVKLSKTKCHFGKESVKFLGHIISQRGIETDPEKTKKIREWECPKTMKDLVTFLGFASYYRKFVQNFSIIAAPLENIVKRDKISKNQQIQWNTGMQDSFHNIKEQLCNAPVLMCPIRNCTFVLDTDASKFGIGAVLSQRLPDGTEKVVHFASNRLSKAEINYCATRKELLAVIHYVKQFSHYLLGKQFIIRTDHKSLTWLMTWKNPSTSQYFSWINELSQYDFIIKHRKGSEHINADVLSRLISCKQCDMKHEDNTIGNANLCQIFTDMQIKAILPMATEMEIKKLSEMSNIVEANQTLYVQEDNTTRIPIITEKAGLILAQKLHSSLCHVGSKKMIESIKPRVFWIGYRKTCKNISENCQICLSRKSIIPLNHKLQHIEATSPLKKICIDIAGPLPEYMGFRYILAVVDCFSRYPCLIPLKSIETETIVAKLFEKWVSIFGAPDVIHSDQGSNFNSRVFNEFCRSYNITKTKTAPYHPQSNALCERLFRTVKDMIFCIKNERGIDWPNALPYIEMALRGTYSSALQCSPYEILFGQTMSHNIFDNSFENVKKFVPNEKLIDFVFKNVVNCDKKTPVEPVKVGDFVMIRIFPVQKSVYKPRFSGPFKVINIKSSGSFITVKNNKNVLIERNIKDIKRCQPFKNSRIVYQAKEQSSNQATPSAPSSTKATPTNDSNIRRYPQRSRQNPVRFV